MSKLVISEENKEKLESLFDECRTCALDIIEFRDEIAENDDPVGAFQGYKASIEDLYQSGITTVEEYQQEMSSLLSDRARMEATLKELEDSFFEDILSCKTEEEKEAVLEFLCA